LKNIISIYNYSDYRRFLKDFYLANKAADSRFTYERFSRQAGIKSPNMLKLVIDGKKNLTNSTILAFAEALSLVGSQKEYFFCLVHLGQAETAREEKYFKGQLRELKPPRIPRAVASSGKGGLYDDIFITIAACLLQGKPVGQELSLFEERLGLRGAEAKFLWARLEKAGLMRAQEGVWTIDVSQVVFHEKIPSQVLRKFLRDQILLSLSAFDAGKNEQVKCLSHVITVDPAEVGEIQEKLDSWLADLNGHYERPTGVPFQINCQSFGMNPEISRDFLSKRRVHGLFNGLS